MAYSGHVSKRQGTKNFQARLRVPPDLIEVLGRKEFTKSLGTADYREAKKLARPIVASWELEFDDLRQRRDLTDNDSKWAAADHYRRQLEQDDLTRLSQPGSAAIEAEHAKLLALAESGQLDLNDRLAVMNASLDYLRHRDGPKAEKSTRLARVEALKEHLASGETALIIYAADEFIARHALNLPKDSLAYKELCHRLMRGEIEFLKRTFERDTGDYSGKPSDPLLQNASLTPLDNTSFASIIDKQVELTSRGLGRGRISPSTIAKYRSQTGGFVKWRQSGRAATVTLDEVEQWRDNLLRGEARKTARDKVATVRAVLQWGQTQSKGKLFASGFPLEHLVLPVAEKKDSAEKTYTVEQASKILRAARKQKASYLRWLPWLSAYTGARIGELSALEKRDLFNIGDDWFIHIRVEGEDRTTKTMQARKVPLHPDLIVEGFVNFVAKADNGKLFPQTRVEQNTRDWIRDDVMKGKKENSPAPNHGFRHLFEDLRFGKLSQEAANYITGRANKGSDRMYGKSNAMLPALAEEMRKFPSILQLP